MTGRTRAQEIRDEIGHPVIDGDGHVVEAPMVLLDYVKQVAGPKVAAKFEEARHPVAVSGLKQIFWGMPSGAFSIDRATAMLPRLFAERLEQAGIDFGVAYSTAILPLLHERDDELRRAGYRALNMLLADMFRDVKHRMTPSAGIPMFTPEEALEELDFVVNELGLKACTFGTEIRVAPPVIEAEAPQLRDRIQAVYSVAMDPPHDFDPVWRKCLDLGVAVACHTSGRGNLGRRCSPSNYVFNHLGDFAEGGEFFCRSLFMGGVTRRFPGLNFAFLEGGAGWAAQLYNDIFEHWEKRNVKMMRERLDPAKLDLDLMEEMAGKYGGELLTPEALVHQQRHSRMGGILDEEIEIDEFKAAGIERPRDIVQRFVEPFYFGCEADDRMNVVAFDKRLHHMGVTLKAMFGSDIGHWDVTDMTTCVPDAYSLVEEGLMNEDDFRAFTFENPVGFFSRQNPRFFEGTAVEADVAKLVAAKAA